ncbi:hypothetical protein [Amnibacterium endophyticum]|uniref:Glycosyl transferase n=1 Tax=Amnibacterium endophyticum TaxID=2109337 RepID=A0ABW4LDV0_9MICO
MPAAVPDQAAILRALLAARCGDRAPREIAVVGNAPLPPSALRARRIDAAGLVVRMTTFALDRAEAAVGRRTDAVVLHRAVVPGPDTFADHGRRLYLLAEPGRDFFEPEALPPWWPTDLELVPVSNRAFTSRTRAALRMGPADIAWPTTGTLAVHLVHRLFPHARILLAGSSLVGRPSRSAHLDHHWGPAVRLTPEHRLHRERRLLHRWRRAGWLEPLA